MLRRRCRCRTATSCPSKTGMPRRGSAFGRCRPHGRRRPRARTCPGRAAAVPGPGFASPRCRGGLPGLAQNGAALQVP
eukprot:5592780-Pyramimonas_sp.AAC.1